MYIAVDFDGTIVDHKFPEIGKTIGAFEWLLKFQEAGAKLILWTMRSDDQHSGNVLSDAVKFCEEHGLIFEHINENPQDWTTSPKAYAKLYIDDAAFGCPLRENPEYDGKPFVDWDIMGPEVLKIIQEKNK